MFPSLRLELFCIFSEEIFPPVKDEDLVVDLLAGFNEDGGFAVWSAPEGEGGVSDCCAGVGGDDGPESEGLNVSEDLSSGWRTYSHSAPS